VSGLAAALASAGACPVCSVGRGEALESSQALCWHPCEEAARSLESLALSGAESLERVECGWLVGEVLECPCCGLNVGERRLASFDAEAREPPQRGALEPFWLGPANGDADRKRVTQVDARYRWMADEIDFSRLYAGGHYLSDLTVGAFLGTAIGDFELRRRLDRHSSRTPDDG
jgi:hypothetical protein